MLLMTVELIISSTLVYLSSLSHKKLLEMVRHLRDSYLSLSQENEQLRKEISELKKEKLSEELKQVNSQSNKPSSKQAEWEEKGVGNDGKGKKRGRGRQGRKGAGNQKKDQIITQTKIVEVEKCFNCGKDLREEPPLKSSNIRIVEDIADTPLETEVIELIQQKKYCSDCQQVVTARSDQALSGADVGLHTSIQLVYEWVVLCLPTTRIALCLQDVFGGHLTTAGISAHLIKVAQILTPVQQDILSNLKDAAIIQADETGWRVAGKLWWMWVVGNQDWAYYTIDKSRGKDVVRKMLGEIFLGVLVVDGWKAYLSLECHQQSCMAHLLRKIRKLYQAFPRLTSVFQFYLKFRKILRDGQRLQSKRAELGEIVFQRRLEKLHQRLELLLAHRNPNDILKSVIKKVKNQKGRILTFVEHDSVPCHNNFAEYLIRIGVLKRKVSFGSKSAKGADAYATLLSIYTTCKLQRIAFLDFLKKSLQYHTQNGKPLLIQQYLTMQKNSA